MKPIKETGLYKFAKSKGLNTVLDGLGSFLPGVGAVKQIKDIILGQPGLSETDKAQIHELASHDMEMYAMELQDVANARNREIEIRKAGGKDWMMALTGIAVLTAFLFMIVALAFIKIPTENKDIYIQVIGFVSSAAMLVIGYFFGSSKGGRQFTDFLAKKS